MALRRRRALLPADHGPGFRERAGDGVCEGVAGGGLRGSLGAGEAERGAGAETAGGAGAGVV